MAVDLRNSNPSKGLDVRGISHLRLFFLFDLRFDLSDSPLMLPRSSDLTCSHMLHGSSRGTANEDCLVDIRLNLMVFFCCLEFAVLSCVFANFPYTAGYLLSSLYTVASLFIVAAPSELVLLCLIGNKLLGFGFDDDVALASLLLIITLCKEYGVFLLYMDLVSECTPY